MKARELVERLEAHPGASSKRNREGDFHVTCPAHADPIPSLHVTDRDGKVLIKCQAGCETEDVLDAAGLDWSALYHDSRNGQGEIVATYDYTDPDGRLVFQAVRYWPKDFRQRQPDGGGGWVWNITDPPCTRWLYRMPRVLEALDRGEPIFIPEGEKDADTLERLGLYATTNPMGAGKWRDEHSRMLIGAADVNVIRDRDEKGHEHAAEVVASLRRAGIESTLLEPREGKDVSDHIAAGGTLEGLVPVVERRRVHDHELLVDMEEALRRAEEPIPHRIDPLTVDGCFTVLTGKRGALKSRLALVLGHGCHAGGKTIAGFVCVGGPTLLVDAENGAYLLGRHFQNLGIPFDGLLVADGSQLKLPGDLGRVEELVERFEIVQVIFDSLRTLAPRLDEDSSKDMNLLVSELRHFTRRTGVAGLGLHHQSSKPGSPPSRGSSAIEDQADILFNLTRHHGDRLKLKCLGKYRPGPEPAPMWFQMGFLPGGAFGLAACDPVGEDDEDEDGAVTAEDVLAEKITRLGDAVAAEGGWAPSRLAKAVESNLRSGTFQRALGGLVESGAWVAEGEGPARRVRPAGSGQGHHTNRAKLRRPLGNGAVGAVSEPENGPEPHRPRCTCEYPALTDEGGRCTRCWGWVS